uniref:Uncharacterized protein n=1 Tax=Setaria digitata TaxID=48799 RepID=A0A915PNG4_9BILA
MKKLRDTRSQLRKENVPVSSALYTSTYRQAQNSGPKNPQNEDRPILRLHLNGKSLEGGWAGLRGLAGGS